MLRRTKILLLLLLTMALPLRGYAAATMMLCGDAHHGAQSGATHASAADHAHHGNAQHHEGMQHEHAQGTDSHDFSAQDDTAKTSVGCGLCGSCCSAAAITAALRSSVTESPASSVASRVAAWRASFIADLPVPPPDRIAA